MPTPKKKTSRSVRNQRRSHDAIKVKGAGNCSNCGSIKAPHRICASCGYYDGREVLPAQA